MIPVRKKQFLTASFLFLCDTHPVDCRAKSASVNTGAAMPFGI